MAPKKRSAHERSSKSITWSRRLLMLLLWSVLAVTVTSCDDDELVAEADQEYPEPEDDCGENGCGKPLDAGFVTPSTDSGQSGVADAGQGGVDSGGGPFDAGSTPQDAGVVVEFLDLNGTYNTVYVLDLSSYLFGLGNLAGPLDTIDQALSGQIDTGIGFVDDLIRDIINQYIPPWVVTVVDVLNNLANFFTNVETTGQMLLAQSPVDQTHAALSATEQWITMTVMIIDSCPLGQSDPTYPACARQNIPIGQPSAVGPLQVGVEVKPFSGTLDPGLGQANFVFTNREVDVEITKLITIVLDLAIRIGTNGQVQSLQDAINRSIDCPSFANAAAGIVQNIIGTGAAQAAYPILEASCMAVKAEAITQIINLINGIGVGFEVLEYDQAGHAVDTNGNRRAETLQVLTTMDTINGRFKFVGSSGLTGEWSGINLAP